MRVPSAASTISNGCFSILRNQSMTWVLIRSRYSLEDAMERHIHRLVRTIEYRRKELTGRKIGGEEEKYGLRSRFLPWEHRADTPQKQCVQLQSDVQVQSASQPSTSNLRRSSAMTGNLAMLLRPLSSYPNTRICSWKYSSQSISCSISTTSSSLGCSTSPVWRRQVNDDKCVNCKWDERVDESGEKKR